MPAASKRIAFDRLSKTVAGAMRPRQSRWPSEQSRPKHGLQPRCSHSTWARGERGGLCRGSVAPKDRHLRAAERRRQVHQPGVARDDAAGLRDDRDDVVDAGLARQVAHRLPRKGGNLGGDRSLACRSEQHQLRLGPLVGEKVGEARRSGASASAAPALLGAGAQHDQRPGVAQPEARAYRSLALGAPLQPGGRGGCRERLAQGECQPGIVLDFRQRPRPAARAPG